MTSTARALPGALMAILLLHVILSMPSHADHLTLARFARLPLELPLVVALVAIVKAVWARAAVVLVACLILTVRLADMGSFQAFSRPFNPVLDLHLLVSGWDLLASSIGRGQAMIAIGLTLGAILLVAALLWAALEALTRIGGRIRWGVLGCCGAALAAGLAWPAVSRFDTAPWVARRGALMVSAAADLRAFEDALKVDPVGTPTFAALAGRDVIVAFVESYGRSFLDDPKSTEAAHARLGAVEARLDGAGWHSASAWVDAPTRGGQSWLSHGTVLSGLWVDGQGRYDRLMTSERRSLNRLFGDAGWRTGAAMPAITQDWPESVWFGYDITLDSAGLAYRGQPFEWVTMPDQYTWSALDRMLRGPGPDMIETALITSHAPWTPLPRIVDWDAVGDGSVFDGTRRDGDSPRAVWSDPERIRVQYALSLDYALEVAGQYIARDGDGALFVLLGDHQPAPLLTGPDAPAAVPLHVIVDDPSLLSRLPGGFVPGMVPAAEAPVLPMDTLRRMFSTAFE